MKINDKIIKHYLKEDIKEYNQLSETLVNDPGYIN